MKKEDVYLNVEVKYKESSGRVSSKGKTYKIYAPAIQSAVVEYLKKYGLFSNNDIVGNFYIELDREYDVMVAVIEKETTENKIKLAAAGPFN